MLIINVNDLKLIIINNLNIVPVLLIFKSKKVRLCIFRGIPKEQLTHTFYVATGGAKSQWPVGPDQSGRLDTLSDNSI